MEPVTPKKSKKLLYTEQLIGITILIAIYCLQHFKRVEFNDVSTIWTVGLFMGMMAPIFFLDES